MYLLFFVYLINNVTTRHELRSVIWAVFVGFIISAGSVVAFFQLGYGTDFSVVSILKEQPAASQGAAFKPSKPGHQTLTLDDQSRRLEKQGTVTETAIKRSQGIFGHPGIAASMCGLILPIILAYLVAARRNRDRILLLTLFIFGVAALVLTFSRAGAIGLAGGICVFFVLAGRSGMISRRLLALGVMGLILAIVVSIPLLAMYFGARPESFLMRFNLFQASLQSYSQHPLGVGLNNSTAAMQAIRHDMKDTGTRVDQLEAAGNLYLVLLSEVGPVGFVLFFAFFWKVVLIAIRAMKEAAADLKPLLVGIVAGFASLATQNVADDSLGSHAIPAMLWLFVSLIVVVARNIQADAHSYPAGGHAALVRPRFAARPLTYSR
jgi:O-antigen ligase